MTARGGAESGLAAARILLVDDNPLALRVQQLHLERVGYRVTVAASAEEALRLVRDARHDLVLSDVMMPGTDGFQLCRALRGDPSTAALPVVLLSGLYGDELDLRHAAHCGANMFVSRGDGPGALERAVRQALRHPGVRLDPGPGSALDAEHADRLARQLDRMASTDLLTGLMNRAVFQRELEQAVGAAARGGHAAGVLVLSLRNFREVNDTLGPDGGDAVLREIAVRLRDAAAGADIVCARLGAAQFGLLLPRLEGPHHQGRAASALQTALALPISVDGIPVEVAPCLGAARCPEDAVLGSELLRRAGVAMHHARTHHLPFAAYAPELDPFSLERLTLVSELRRAIAHNQLELWYQPKLELRSGRVESAEALVRWHHPGRGMIPPDAFIPAAERTGLIHLLTGWVLETALRQLARWHDAGLCLGVAINVTQNDLRDASFKAKVLRAIDVHGLPPDKLTLEITESAAIEDPRRCVETLGELRQHGLRFALDDFGTGQASLAHLHRLPVDELKLDKSFALGLPEAGSRTIAGATALLARAFRLKSVAEGVEDAARQRLLRELGFDAIQGHGVSAPLPAADFEAWLRKRQAASG